MTSNSVVKPLDHSYGYALRDFSSISCHIGCHFVLIDGP